MVKQAIENGGGKSLVAYQFALFGNRLFDVKTIEPRP
jgi:hypothetical protein